MPYLLRAGSATDTRLTLASAITYPTATTTSAKIELDFSFASTAAFATYLRSETGTSTDQGTLRIEKNASNQLVIAITLSGKARVITTITAVSINTRYLVSVEWDSISQNIIIKLDGATQSTLTGYTQFNVANFIQILSSANSSPCDIYDLRFYRNGALVNDYDPSSISSGTILPDAQSGNTATQAGTWPSDNSEWVFYSSGASNTATVSATLPKITGSLTLNEINPSYVISANGQLPKITGAVTLNEINPAFTVAVSGQLPKITGSIALNQFANNRQVTVNGVLPKLTGAVTLNRIQPNNQASVSGQLPRITASITLRVPDSYPTANPNDYTVSAYLSTDSTYTARLSESGTINAIISASSTFNARLN